MLRLFRHDQRDNLPTRRSVLAAGTGLLGLNLPSLLGRLSLLLQEGGSGWKGRSPALAEVLHLYIAHAPDPRAVIKELASEVLTQVGSLSLHDIMQ